MFESIKDRFRERYIPFNKERKSLKDRVKELEKTVGKLEQASNMAIEREKIEGFFDTMKWVGVSTVLRELLYALGYKLIYRAKVRKSSCIEKKEKGKQHEKVKN